MAFPVVQTTNEGNSGANTTSHTVNLPTGINSGDLLIFIFCCDVIPTITWPSGWTQLMDVNTSNNFASFGVFYRIADGTEGASVTVTTSSNEGSAHISYRITGYLDVPELGGQSIVNTNNPNPGSFDPSWGTEDTLWLAVMGYNGNHAFNSGPTGYTNVLDNRWANSNGTGVASAQKESAAASEDPGNFNIAASNDTAAATIAIRPASAVATERLQTRIMKNVFGYR